MSTIWDPEPVEVCGKPYTLCMPSARDTLDILPEIQRVQEMQSEDGSLPPSEGVDIFSKLVRIGVEEFIGKGDAVDRLPLTPLMQLGQMAMEKLTKGLDYADEQKKTSDTATTSEPSGHSPDS